MRLFVLFVFLQVLHVPVCTCIQCGLLCMHVNVYCICVFMGVSTGNTCS